MKTAVLLSGGVDSSVCLNILKRENYDCTAFYLKIWLEEEMADLGDCPWEEDLAFARQVCDMAGVELKIVSLQSEYYDKVVSYAANELKSGRTPSPDIMCNQRIKFGAFFDKIDSAYTKVATGHYARIEKKSGQYFLKKAKDTLKDQTYFLSHISQDQLARLSFPVGDYTKKEVRHLAQEYNLPNQDRKDSQGICFLGKIKYNDFIKHYCGERDGNIVNIDTGKVCGAHKGFWFYTLGQRQGIGLSGGPWYVVKKDVDKNIIYISNKSDLDQKARDTFSIGSCNWFSGKRPAKSDLDIKIRHGERIIPAHTDFISNDEARVRMSETDTGIAPGQFAVFYDQDYCLGGGTITK